MKYIDVDKLKAVLERRMNLAQEIGKAQPSLVPTIEYAICEYDALIKNINSFQRVQIVVDLEKEIEQAALIFPEVSFAKLSRIAVRFYNLGLNARKEE